MRFGKKVGMCGVAALFVAIAVALLPGGIGHAGEGAWSAGSLTIRQVPEVKAYGYPAIGTSVWRPDKGGLALELAGIFTVPGPPRGVETTQIGIVYEGQDRGQMFTREHEMIGFAVAEADGTCGAYEFPRRLLGGSYTVETRGVKYTVARPVKDGPGRLTVSEGRHRLCFCFVIPQGVDGPFTLRLTGAEYRVGKLASP